MECADRREATARPRRVVSGSEEEEEKDDQERTTGSMPAWKGVVVEAEREAGP